MKYFGRYILLTFLLTAGTQSFAQFSNPMSGLDTLYMPSDTLGFTVDPDPANNPYLNSAPSQMRAADDPGGPGSGGGGGFGDPVADAIIPLDGGVGVLVVAGALLGLKRRKKITAPKLPAC